MKTVVVIPAYNEERTVENVVRAALRVADGVVVVDDCSSDATPARALAAGADVVRHGRNFGYDSSLNDGFTRAASLGADIIVTCDADGQHNPEDISRLIQPIVRGEADVALSVRPQLTRTGERILAAYTKWRYGISDPLSGLKAYRRSVYDRFGHFDTIRSIGTQLSIEAAETGCRLAFVPIVVASRPPEDASRFYVRRLRGNLRILGACLRLIVHRVQNTPSMSTLAILEGRTEPLRQKPYNAIGGEEAAAAQRVMESRNLSGFLGRAGDGFFGGPEVRALEHEFQGVFGVRHAVSFNSASTALQAAVTAVGIGPGDEVVTSPYTMSATPSAVLLNGAVPVFADVDEMTGCLDPASVEARITPRTRAILVVNLFGMSADYDRLRKIADEHKLFIIEDSAQAPGATYRGRLLGTIGDVGVFSLNVHKVIQCGEGGVLVTNNDRFAYRSQLVRNHGEVIVDDLDGQREFEAVAGSNYRLSEVHAAIAREQLKKLNELNAVRWRGVTRLISGLKRFPWLIPAEPADHVMAAWYQYPFRYLADRLGGVSRETFVAAMRAEGFPLGAGYVKPIYWFPLYQRKQMYPNSSFPFVSSEYPTDVSYDRGICPVVERLWERELLTTTVFVPPNTDETVDAFLDACDRVAANAEALRSYETNHPSPA